MLIQDNHLFCSQQLETQEENTFLSTLFFATLHPNVGNDFDELKYIKLSG